MKTLLLFLKVRHEVQTKFSNSHLYILLTPDPSCAHIPLELAAQLWHYKRDSITNQGLAWEIHCPSHFLIKLLELRVCFTYCLYEQPCIVQLRHCRISLLYLFIARNSSFEIKFEGEFLLSLYNYLVQDTHEVEYQRAIT